PRERNLKNIKSIHENVRYHCKLCPYTTNRARYISEHVKFIKKINHFRNFSFSFSDHTHNHNLQFTAPETVREERHP
ncbi:MAG: hypothetical protein ACK55Z_29760, partial [bacterium]